VDWKALVVSPEHWKMNIKAIVDSIVELAIREAVEGRKSPADMPDLALSAGSIGLLRSHGWRVELVMGVVAGEQS
jgi:hypothetical protein